MRARARERAARCSQGGALQRHAVGYTSCIAAADTDGHGCHVNALNPSLSAEIAVSIQFSWERCRVVVRQSAGAAQEQRSTVWQQACGGISPPFLVASLVHLFTSLFLLIRALVTRVLASRRRMSRMLTSYSTRLRLLVVLVPTNVSVTCIMFAIDRSVVRSIVCRVSLTVCACRSWC